MFSERVSISVINTRISAVTRGHWFEEGMMEDHLKEQRRKHMEGQEYDLPLRD